MRITRARVFGFGKWVDYELEFPKYGPAVIFGENESGKTTFYQFILFMLFGMQPKERKFYQPKTSSKLGGQLVVEDSEVGQFTIERFDNESNGKATCMLPTGEIYDEVWLRERLHGMDQKTFKSIFSFTALDLNAIKDMKEEELGDVLLSVGLTGSSSIYKKEKELDTLLGNLFKPYGKNPEINKQLQIVQEIFAELTAIKEEEATYQEKRARSEALQQNILYLQEQQSLLEDESKWIGKQLTALPLLEEYQDLTKKQERVQKELPFPVNGIERLENIKDTLRPLESEDAVLRGNEDSYRNHLAELEKGQLPKEVFQELLEKQKMREIHKQIEEQIQEVNVKKQAITREIIKKRSELQIDLLEEDLDDLSLPFYIEEKWKQLKKNQDRLEQEKTNLEMENNALTEEQAYLKNRLHREKEGTLSEKELVALERKINEGKESEQLERLYQSTREQHYNYRKDHKEKIKRSNLFFWIGTILSVFGVAVAFLSDQTFIYILSAILFILSLGYVLFTKWNGKEIEKLLQAPVKRGRGENISPDEMNNLRKRLREEEERHAGIRALQSDLNRQQISVLQWKEKERSFKEKKQRLKEQLDEQHRLYPFLQGINPVYWPEYYNRLKTLLQMQEEEKEQITKMNELEMKRERLETEISSFVNGLRMEPFKEIHSSFTFIEELIEKENNLKARKAHLMELIEETEDKRTDMTNRIAGHKKEMNELFYVANAEREEEFHERAAYLTEKEQVEEALERNERQLNTIFEEKEWKNLGSTKLNEENLESQKKEMEGKQTEIHQELEKLRSKYAEVNAELRRLEGSDAYSLKMHQFEMEKEKLNHLAKEWSILKIEKEVLAETKQRYQEKYLSKVMRETTNLLHLITGGRYEAVYSPEDLQPFQVIASNGLRYSVEELSQGTINQLYVSLRLSISKVMTEEHQVPFIVDDAFVHFDALRVKRMMQVLAEVSERQQVIMFTCKLDVKEACQHLEIPVIAV